MEEGPNQSTDSPLPTDSPGESPLHPISPLIEYSQPPRLGIIHLLAWVTVAAVLMKLNLALEVLPSGSANLNLSETYLLAGKLQQAARVIVTAALFVGGFVFWLDRYRRKPGYLQPGHWIVGIDGLLELESLIFRTIFIMAVARNSEVAVARSTGMMVYSIANMLIGIAAFLFAVWRLPERWRWKLALGIEAFPVFRYYLFSPFSSSRETRFPSVLSSFAFPILTFPWRALS